MLSVRPKIAELVLQLYGRPLHPELFEIYATRTVEREHFKFQLHITSAGHLITWRYQGFTFSEVAASAQHPLPERRRLMNQSVKRSFHDQVRGRAGVHYRVKCEIEQATPEMFWGYQQQMTPEATGDALVHRFDSSGRMAMGALSFIHYETRARTLLIRALHTFPDDHAIVTSQSVFALT